MGSWPGVDGRDRPGTKVPICRPDACPPARARRRELDVDKNQNTGSVTDFTLSQQSVPSADIAVKKSKVLYSKVVPNTSGLAMASAERIAFLRQHAAGLDCHGKVRETNAPEASRATYARTTFTCHGIPERACPYALEMYYYIKKAWVNLETNNTPLLTISLIMSRSDCIRFDCSTLCIMTAIVGG